MGDTLLAAAQAAGQGRDVQDRGGTVKPIPLEKQKEIARNWRNMKEGFYKQQRLIAELAAHPDVTDQMILERVRELGETYKGLKEVQHSLRELEYKNMFRYSAGINSDF